MPSKMYMLIQQWHGYCTNNQQLSNLSDGLLYGKELMSDATYKPEQAPMPGEVIGPIGRQLLLFCSIDMQITVPSKHLYLDSLII